MIRYLLASTVPGMKRPWSTDDEEPGLEGRAPSIGEGRGALVRVGTSEPSPVGAPQAPQNRLPPETSAPQAGQRITAPNGRSFRRLQANTMFGSLLRPTWDRAFLLTRGCWDSFPGTAELQLGILPPLLREEVFRGGWSRDGEWVPLVYVDESAAALPAASRAHFGHRFLPIREAARRVGTRPGGPGRA
jgi:hypothetical protein